MPGSPPSSPNLGLPRYNDDDVAGFSAQINAIIDAIDAKGGWKWLAGPGAWTALTLPAGAAAAGVTPAARIVGDTIELRGGITTTTAAALVSVTLPSFAAPSSLRRIPGYSLWNGSSWHTAYIPLQVSGTAMSSANLGLGDPILPANAPGYIAVLDGLSYPL